MPAFYKCDEELCMSWVSFFFFLAWTQKFACRHTEMLKLIMTLYSETVFHKHLQLWSQNKMGKGKVDFEAYTDSGACRAENRSKEAEGFVPPSLRTSGHDHCNVLFCWEHLVSSGWGPQAEKID